MLLRRGDRGPAVAEVREALASLQLMPSPSGADSGTAEFDVATDGAIRAIGQANAQATRAVQAKRSATGRAIEPEDLAGTVGFLCSPLARNVTGEIVTVDGGFSRAYL